MSCDWVTGLVAWLICSRGLEDWVDLSPYWVGKEVPTPSGRMGLGLIQSPCPLLHCSLTVGLEALLWLMMGMEVCL